MWVRQDVRMTPPPNMVRHEKRVTMVGVCEKSHEVEIFFCVKVLLALLFQMLSKYFNNRKYSKPVFKDLLTFDLAQPTHPNPEERENADLGEGRGFKDITRIAKAVHNFSFQGIFFSFQSYQRRKEVSNIG